MLDDLNQQAEVFGRYILKTTPANDAVVLYANKLKTDNGKLSTADKRLLHLALKHPWTLGFIDGGLALIKPNSEVRRRLFFMFAILEATPEHSEHFLAAKKNFLYIFVVAAIGIRAIFRSLVGIILVKACGA